MVIYFTLGGNDFLNGMPGLSGFITMALAILGIWIYDKHISKDNILSMTLGDSIGRETAGLRDYESFDPKSRSLEVPCQKERD